MKMPWIYYFHVFAAAFFISLVTIDAQGFLDSTCPLAVLEPSLLLQHVVLQRDGRPKQLSGLKGAKPCPTPECQVGTTVVYKCGGQGSGRHAHGYVQSICTHEGWTRFNRQCEGDITLGHTSSIVGLSLAGFTFLVTILGIVGTKVFDKRIEFKGNKYDALNTNESSRPGHEKAGPSHAGSSKHSVEMQRSLKSVKGKSKSTHSTASKKSKHSVHKIDSKPPKPKPAPMQQGLSIDLFPSNKPIMTRKLGSDAGVLRKFGSDAGVSRKLGSDGGVPGKGGSQFSSPQTSVEKIGKKKKHRRQTFPRLQGRQSKDYLSSSSGGSSITSRSSVKETTAPGTLPSISRAKEVGPKGKSQQDARNSFSFAPPLKGSKAGPPTGRSDSIRVSTHYHFDVADESVNKLPKI